MIRILPDAVVNAYYETNLIPVRGVWATEDGRGASAIKALARFHKVKIDTFRDRLSDGYEEGFILAWDAVDPCSKEVVSMIKAEEDESIKRGFCDGFLCRSAVEKTFSSSAISSVSN